MPPVAFNFNGVGYFMSWNDNIDELQIDSVSCVITFIFVAMLVWYDATVISSPQQGPKRNTLALYLLDPFMSQYSSRLACL